MREYRVSRHPSGRRTLTVKEESEKMPHDLKGALWGNLDPASFYRAVARELGDAAHKGIKFRYNDADDEAAAA